jgi:hypothetical protein
MVVNFGIFMSISNIEMNMDTDKVIIENSDQTYHHGSNFDQGSSKRNNFNAKMIFFLSVFVFKDWPNDESFTSICLRQKKS